MLSSWIRVVRVRFLLSSIVGVCLGLAITWWDHQSIDPTEAILTLFGVVALHSSVDLLNDYWDFKRNIDTKTTRTALSGGTGVLPDGLLKPKAVYTAGICALILGSIIGMYFIFLHGLTIAIILAFAIVSIYFYSTRIVDSGLGEVFVVIKGTMIVIGTYFVQSSQITTESILGGLIIGILSSLVLFVNSFPDYKADKASGRKTFVIYFGRKKSTKLIWLFPIISYGIILLGVSFHNFPIYSLIALSTFPILIKSGQSLKQNYDNLEKLLPIMKSVITYSRLTGTLLVVSFIISLPHYN